VPWMSQNQAAHALGVSQRTLSRRIKAEEVQTKQDGHRVMAYVEDEALANPVAKLSDVGSQLAKLSEEMLNQRRLDAASMAATVQTCNVALETSRASTRSWQRTAMGAVVVFGGLLVGAIVLITQESKLAHREALRAVGLEGNVTILEVREEAALAERDRIDQERIEANRRFTFAAEELEWVAGERDEAIWAAAELEHRLAQAIDRLGWFGSDLAMPELIPDAGAEGH